jgi:hypothetical protein
MIDFDSFHDNVKRCEERAVRMDKAYWNLKFSVLDMMNIFDELVLGNPKVTLDCIRIMVEGFILEYAPITEVSKDNLS